MDNIKPISSLEPLSIGICSTENPLNKYSKLELVNTLPLLKIGEN